MDMSFRWTVTVAVHLLFWIIFRSVVKGSVSEGQPKLVIGIICDGAEMAVARKINSTWWPKFQQPVRTKSGTAIQVDIVYLQIPSTQSLFAANEVVKVIREKPVSMVIGRYELLYDLATADQKIPFIVTDFKNDDDRGGSRTRTKKESGSSSSSSTSSSGPLGSSSPSLPLPLRLWLMPLRKSLHRALTDLVQIFRWKNSVALIYESMQGLGLMGTLMEEKEFEVRGWKVSSEDDDVRLRDQLSSIRSLEIRQIIVECEPRLMERLLNAALRLSMLSMRYSWIFAHPLPTSVDYDPFNYTGVNFTALSISMVDKNPLTIDQDTDQLTTAYDHLAYLMTHDALDLMTVTLMTSSVSGICSKTGGSDDCLRNHSAVSNGLLRRMQETSVEGLSGKIQFDFSGQRIGTSLKVLALSSNGLQEIGDWVETRTERLKITKWTNQSHQLSTRPLLRMVNRVVTLIDPPFVMYKKNHQNLTGNDRYEGFLVDLFDQIAKNLKFDYELYESPDGNYGSKDSRGNWNGMIRELIIGNASMCLGAISITSDREEVVDFTKPFKQKMFNFLMKKPEEISTIFQFLSPLSTLVWIAILSSLVLVSVLLYLMDRFSPNFPPLPDPDRDPDRVDFDLRESIWFMYGALVGGGTEGWNPRRLSGRLLTSAWWFFGLIIISSYTANLAAFLTVTRIETPIKSITDLALQKQVRYGTVRNTYAMSMFKNSKLEILQTMWYNMGELHPDWMVGNTQEGIEKAKDGDYAFIWDAPINRHIAMHDCAVISTGEPFDEKGYGIGMPTGASYRDDLTMEILSLGEKGEIVKLENRWWRTGECPVFTETSTGSNEELNMFNVAGVFLLLAFGVVLALVACLIEYLTSRLMTTSKLKRTRFLRLLEAWQQLTPGSRPEAVTSGTGTITGRNTVEPLTIDWTRQ